MHDEFWQSVLEQLKMQMSLATFDAWVRDTSLINLGHNKAIIGVANTFAKDWLEHRLAKQIQRTLSMLLDREIEVEFTTQSDKSVAKDLYYEGVRAEAYTNIVKPEKVFVGSQYFRQVWLPVLGPTLWLLILELRQRCYKNEETGEVRETCSADYKDLARAVGISERQAYRLLNSKKASIFIISKTTIRRFSDKVGKEVNVGTRWKIRMDEPILTDELLEELSE